MSGVVRPLVHGKVSPVEPPRPLSDASPETSQRPGGAPSLRRRFASMLYEAMLLFAVTFVAGYLFDTLTQSRSAMMFRPARQAWLFGVLGLYFVWFWMHGGQTLAMKTWRVRIATASGQPLHIGRAVVRYLLLWIVLLPTLGAAEWLGWQRWSLVAAIAAAVLVAPLFALFDRDRQFLHDRLAGTRVVSL